MKIIINDYIPFEGYIAMNLFGVLFVRREYSDRLSESVIRHESVHSLQQKELLWIGFYIWYLIEYFIRLICYFNHKKAYKNICFEREANDLEHSAVKVYIRKRYNWLHYITKERYEKSNRSPN